MTAAIRAAFARLPWPQLVSGALLIAAVGLFSLTRQYNLRRGISGIQVKLQADDRNRFLEHDRLRQALGEALTGSDHDPYASAGLLLNETGYLYDIQLNTSAEYELSVRAKVRMPIMRVTGFSKSFYVDATGAQFPASSQFAARVLLLRMPKPLTDTTELAHQLLLRQWVEVGRLITQDSLLNPYLAEVQVLPSGEGILYSQVGNLQIQFGLPTNPVEKLTALKTMLQRVLIHTGWGLYRELDLRYAGQVVARKAAPPIDERNFNP